MCCPLWRPCAAPEGAFVAMDQDCWCACGAPVRAVGANFGYTKGSGGGRAWQSFHAPVRAWRSFHASVREGSAGGRARRSVHASGCVVRAVHDLNRSLVFSPRARFERELELVLESVVTISVYNALTPGTTVTVLASRPPPPLPVSSRTPNQSRTPLTAPLSMRLLPYSNSRSTYRYARATACYSLSPIGGS